MLFLSRSFLLLRLLLLQLWPSSSFLKRSARTKRSLSTIWIARFNKGRAIHSWLHWERIRAGGLPARFIFALFPEFAPTLDVAARLFIDVFHQLVKQHADHAPLQDAQAAVGKLPVPDVPVSSYLRVLKIWRLNSRRTPPRQSLRRPLLRRR